MTTYLYFTGTRSRHYPVQNQTGIPANDEPLIADMADRWPDVIYFTEED